MQMLKAVNKTHCMIFEGPVVISRMKGGVGNQLFMYAAARALAERTGAELILDIAEYPRTGERAFGLYPAGLRERLIDIFEPTYTGGPIAIYHEPHFFYDEEFERLSSPLILHGFWQSERYFYKISPIIRSQFSMREESLSFTGRKNLEVIRRARNPVSLHVRFGDAVGQPRRYPLPTERYYRHALNVLKALRGPDFTVLIFAENNAEALTFFPWLSQYQFLEPNIENPLEDIWMMSQCVSHINANSTFSWWGAWLGNGPNKFTICPRLWFGPELAHLATLDLIPAGWITL